MPEISGLDHLVLTVRDLATTTAFYRDVLAMRVETFTSADGNHRFALRFGRQKINLHKAGAEFLPNAAVAQPGSADLCFLSPTPVADWITHLSALGLKIEDGPVARSGAQGPILSIYLRDPDGNLIEIANSV